MTACESNPTHARNLADEAILLVEMLDNSRYAEVEVTRLKAAALIARARALRRLGKFSDALEALDRAERLLNSQGETSGAAANVDYVRATILSVQGQLDAASDAAARAAVLFAAQGNTSRYLDTQMLIGGIHARRGQMTAARDIFLPLLAHAEADKDLERTTRLKNNLGLVCLELGEITTASAYLSEATTGWNALDRPTEAVRSKWVLAKLLVVTGRFAEAASRLAAVQEEFRSFSMVDEVALVQLERVEALLLGGFKAEAARLCKGLAKDLIAMGLNPAAYTALAYLHELAVVDKLAVPAVQEVGGIIRALQAASATHFPTA